MAIWDNLGGGGDVEDRRGVGGLLPIGGGVVSLIIVFVLGYFGISADPALVEQLLSASGISTGNSSEQSTEFKGADSYETFASNVIGSTDRYWSTQINGYDGPKLVLFRNATNSGCGVATSEVGPHYCPADSTIYLDETFFDVLAQRYGGNSGDVAQAYVMAHEVAHHVQNVNGTMQRVQSDPAYQATGSNSLSVRLELQADCYAGAWANSIKDQNVFESDAEIQEAIDAAGSVGDDRIQSTTGTVNPETWTHGSSQQRVAAFQTGWQSGDSTRCQL
ncbi:MAG: neutral zinc metallopeptidase [Patescibacteria group bacterium]